MLTTADFNLHITVWSLTSKTVYYVDDPKDPVNGVSFTHDGKYLAVARRKACKDRVGIYHCGTWELVKGFAVDTVDLVELQWSPDDRCVGRRAAGMGGWGWGAAPWAPGVHVSWRLQRGSTSPLHLRLRGGYPSVLVIRDTIMQYGLLVYSADGHKQQKFEVRRCPLPLPHRSPHQRVACAPRCPMRCSAQAYKYCLGIKSMCFSPNGQFLALGSYDEKVCCVAGARPAPVAAGLHLTVPCRLFARRVC